MEEREPTLRKEYEDYVIRKEQNVIDEIERLVIDLPNGKQNEAYEETKIRLEHDAVLNYRIVGAEVLGLECEPVYKDGTNSDKPEFIRLFGTPNTAGENLALTLEYEIESYTGTPVTKERKIKLFIAADPRTLWKDIPTPNNIPYYKEDEYCSSMYIMGEKNIVAASKRGRSHAHLGNPRDDHYTFKHLDNGWYILAVADGAGSAKYSRQGSKIACDTVLEHCSEALNNSTELDEAIFKYYAPSEIAKDVQMPDDTGLALTTQSAISIINNKLYKLLGYAAFNAHQAIIKEAQKTQFNTRDYATTMLLSICKKFGESGWFIATYWVGDGAIGLYTEEEIKLIGEPDGGDFAGQTRFLTMPEVVTSEALAARTKATFVKDFKALMLMTDGVSDPKFETDSNLESLEKWDELWDEICTHVQLSNEQTARTELLDWLDFWAKGNHDDRTILILF